MTGEAPRGPSGTGGGLRLTEDEPRAMGLPLRWFAGVKGLDLRPIRHLAACLAWRRERRRLGPYARSLDEVVAGRRGEPS